ncbi:MAG: C39 family peptidase [bacterium]|nr:C39 family peptidase [bacterium]
MYRSIRFKKSTHGSAWLSLSVLAMAIATTAWQHAALGMPVLSGGAPADPPMRQTPQENTRAILNFENPPPHVFLDVPFTPQAPFDNWSDPYREACEEASVVMAMAWVRGDEPADGVIPPDQARAQILELIGFETYHFGYHNDTALRETAKLLTRHYRHPAAVFYDITPGNIRSALAAGNIMIVPVAGALLENPYFASPPPYHMLVIHGYDDLTQEFITNDPGTRSGANYRYPYATLWNAIHDWTGSDATIANGRKGMIVVGRP